MRSTLGLTLLKTFVRQKARFVRQWRAIDGSLHLKRSKASIGCKQSGVNVSSQREEGDYSDRPGPHRPVRVVVAALSSASDPRRSGVVVRSWGFLARETRRRRQSPPPPSPQTRCPVGTSRPGEAGVIICGLRGGGAAPCAITLAPTAQTKLDQDPNTRGSHGVILPLCLSALSSPQRRVQQCWRRAVRFQVEACCLLI